MSDQITSLRLAVQEKILAELDEPDLSAKIFSDSSNSRLAVWNNQTNPAQSIRDWNPPVPTANQEWILEPQAHWTGEGINIHDPVITYREETCQKIANLASKNAVTIVDSPPYSGKTSLIKLLARHVRSKGHYCEIGTWIHGLPQEPDEDPSKNLVKHWRNELQPQYDKLSKHPPGKYKFFLVDEAQKSYCLGSDHTFWQLIKKRLQVSKGIIFVLFSSWGSAPLPSGTGTPVSIQSRLHLQDINLTFNESEELIDNFNNSQRFIEIQDNAKLFLLNSTAYHVGHIRHTLEKLKTLPKERHHTESEIINAIQVDPSITFETCFEKTRMAKPSTFDPQQKELVMKIFREEYVQFQYEHLPLIKNGVLSYLYHITTARWLVFFSSPWVKKCYLQAMYCKVPPKTFRYFDPVKPNIDDFIYEALSRMSKKRIMDGANLQKSVTPTEYVWQSEFYRAACSCLTDSSCISPEFYTNGEHRLDFYISSMLKYGFELLRDGHGIQNHISRFAPGGSYYGLVEDGFIIHHRVINFRLQENYQSTKLEVIYACFDETKGHFIVVNKSHRIEIPLVE